MRLPIHMAETVSIGSIEGFLRPAETAALRQVMETFLACSGSGQFGAERSVSIHEIPGHTAAEAMAAYEPAGRVEVAAIPTEANRILQLAFDRARPTMARFIPSVTGCRPWTYVEYGPGQRITTHVDGIAPDPLAWPRQVAGISVVVGEPERGGAFYVETTSDARMWQEVCDGPGSGYAPGTWLAHDGADHSAAWFRDMPRTRWRVEAPAGTALLYGSQLAHGTEPVAEGTARKFISWLIAEAGGHVGRRGGGG